MILRILVEGGYKDLFMLQGNADVPFDEICDE
jgi:hypothetical protein